MLLSFMSTNSVSFCQETELQISSLEEVINQVSKSRLDLSTFTNLILGRGVCLLSLPLPVVNLHWSRAASVLGPCLYLQASLLERNSIPATYFVYWVAKK